MSNITTNAQMKKASGQEMQRLPFGTIKPAGWLKKQMQQDMNGFVGHLDELVPTLINDPIYTSGRLHKNSKLTDLGNSKEGDAEGDEQYMWWNSETQSNWLDGYIRNAILLQDKQAFIKVKTYIDKILSSQDADGYLGIYDKDLRYNFHSENGELWSKATLYRGLLAYYEYTKDQKVWNAIIRAIDNVMQNYPINESNPFNVGTSFSGGVAHGLTFTDVLDRMYQLTNDRKYIDYAVFLYLNFSENETSEKDAQLKNILNPDYRLWWHAVHTYEHIRPLAVSAYASPREDLKEALKIYLSRIENAVTATGGPIGDEWIAGRNSDGTNVGYEYCSIHELMDSYTVLLQKWGKANIADKIENIFYNAAQGSRNPLHSCIAYLKTDNSFEMMGTKNGEVEPDRKQTRYKYSPAHQDVAVCCNPNAGRISPYFVQSSWMKQGNDTLVATLLMPNIVETTIKNTYIKIENTTDYPFKNKIRLKISSGKPLEFCLKIRKPQWVNGIHTSEKIIVKDNYIVINRTFSSKDNIDIEFTTAPRIITQRKENYFAYGALIFAYPIQSEAHKGKEYTVHFTDLMYSPLNYTSFEYIKNENPVLKNGKLMVKLKNKSTQTTETVKLIPFGKTILRQASF